MEHCFCLKCLVTYIFTKVTRMLILYSCDLCQLKKPLQPGTDVSQVSGNVDSFDNITVARPLRIADKTLVNLIKELPSYVSKQIKL